MMSKDNVAVITDVMIFPANGPSVAYHIGKRIATPEDAQNYWEISVIQIIKAEPHFLHIGVAGVDLESKGWGTEVVFSGDYSISFDPTRIKELDMDAEALAAAAL